jgi:hypothetical protein
MIKADTAMKFAKVFLSPSFLFTNCSYTPRIISEESSKLHPLEDQWTTEFHSEQQVDANTLPEIILCAKSHIKSVLSRDQSYATVSTESPREDSRVKLPIRHAPQLTLNDPSQCFCSVALNGPRFVRRQPTVARRRWLLPPEERMPGRLAGTTIVVSFAATWVGVAS